MNNDLNISPRARELLERWRATPPEKRKMWIYHSNPGEGSEKAMKDAMDLLEALVEE